MKLITSFCDFKPLEIALNILHPNKAEVWQFFCVLFWVFIIWMW